MSKEIIYIDPKDDITTVIDNIKKSAEKFIALVPPKQTGILQSAVNLRLLAKVSRSQKKVLIIVTNNQALIRLASMTKIPIAKSFKSKPELIEFVPLKVDGEDDIIDGADLTVGEFDDNQKANIPSVDTKPKSEPVKTDLQPAKIKVPNYNKFRNRLIIATLVIIALIGFGVWAIIFAPRADLRFRTKSKTVNIATSVDLTTDSEQANFDKKILASQVQTVVKKQSLEFVATGEKEVGRVASGELTLTRALGGAVDVPAGSGFSKDDCTFITTKPVVVPAATLEFNGSGIVAGSVKVPVESNQIGEDCNISSGNYMSTVSGIKAKGDKMTGGEKHTVKIITQDDLDKALEKFNNQTDDDNIKELRNKFDSLVIIIDDSLDIKQGEIKQPKVDDEAKEGKAKLERENEYKLFGIAKKDLEKLIEIEALANDKSSITQKVYQADDQKIDFTDYVVSGDKRSVRILTQTKIGPKIEKSEILEFVKGKLIGEIQAKYETTGGIQQVKIDLSPFWVNRVPKDDKKIKIEIEIVD